MKVLVAYYSRTGTTKRVAETIGAELGCDVEEIIDLKNRRGLIGFLTGGYSAYRKKLTDIKKPEKDPATYDLLIIGTPVWASQMTPAIRTYIMWLKSTGAINGKKLAFFCTSDSGEEGAILSSMANLAGKETLATMCIENRNMASMVDRVKAFVARLFPTP